MGENELLTFIIISFKNYLKATMHYFKKLILCKTLSSK